MYLKKKKHLRQGTYHPWTILADNKNKRDRARMASAYGQCDLVKLWNGNVRLTFNSLYPIEKGFFKSQVIKKQNPLKMLSALITDEGLPIRDIFQSLFMQVPLPMVNYIQSGQYDYWKILNEEYQFAISKNGISTQSKIYIPGGVRRIFKGKRKVIQENEEFLNIKGIYQIPSDRTELKALLLEDKIVMILTIEGMHALGTDAGNLTDWKKRVDEIKKWEYPVFFITFAHHFNNGLCGHAHSFPDISTKILDQKGSGFNGKFTKAGWVIIRKLLALDTNNDTDPSEGYRILIDVKHMSANSRLEYYKHIVMPCFEKGTIIPVIASHCGYSGRKTLNELIDHTDKESDDYFSNGFYAWNINVCNEDIEMIFLTEGLLGISLDQRILGVPAKQKTAGGKNTIDCIWSTIRAAVKAIYTSSNPQVNLLDKTKIWDHITLGSDFGGYIDPVNPYPDALEYKDLKLDLIEIIEKERISTQHNQLFGLTNTQDVKSAVQKICYDNAKAFVLKWYP
ncbi:hypothetical protein V6R21_10160 [Limibacter armeniacum]|uniref:hypothetical protein n=1 Tax=Limibacter armeniacum TaxID=466084 RepID=UPI002FE5453A